MQVVEGEQTVQVVEGEEMQGVNGEQMQGVEGEQMQGVEGEQMQGVEGEQTVQVLSSLLLLVLTCELRGFFRSTCNLRYCVLKLDPDKSST